MKARGCLLPWACLVACWQCCCRKLCLLPTSYPCAVVVLPSCSPLAGTREVWSIVLMNSVNLVRGRLVAAVASLARLQQAAYLLCIYTARQLPWPLAPHGCACSPARLLPCPPPPQAVVCSVYYSFCGNAPAGSVGPGGSLKEAVCLKWLHPVSASSHSAFTRWVVYGEASAAANASSVAAAAANASAAAAAAVVAVNGLAGGGNQTRSTLQVDFPLDGKVWNQFSGLWNSFSAGIWRLAGTCRRSAGSRAPASPALSP